MNPPVPSRTTSPDVRQERLERIRQVVEDRVRPDLMADGGDVEIVGIDDDDIVQIRLLGACQGCVSTVHTTTMLVEKAVKAEVPEVRFLEAIP
ncbi:NifU family protein [Paludisphaera soli]|uniref:NifU family protein n=1 Tax=Paludisphaera soli TaxID=2712865 RepID=UPI0013EC71D0|nr:NifU family protein [Paludisphaera soli]